MASTASPNSPLLARLRAETQERHALLDSIVSDAVLTTRMGYASFLTASLLSVSAIEAGIVLKLSENFLSLRVESLRSDLLALGTSTPQASLPLHRADEPATVAAAWGTAYVVEGSALGGLVLAQRVQLALGADVPLRYLLLRGAGTKAYWREFLSGLSQFALGAPEEAHAQAVAAARRTFDLYSSAFQRVFPQGAAV
jgi:heme oxygenase